MLKVLNNGEYDKVPAEMKRWNRAGGKVLAGLVRRREAEARLFLIPGGGDCFK
jgi:GH24 family phage-related lysozyme (muramidase)